MAPNQETLLGSYSKTPSHNSTFIQKPPRLSMETLQRSISDISFELSKEAAALNNDHDQYTTKLPPISEVEDAKCECCGMCEECTPEYINGVRNKFSGKLVCGLCGEAVKEEMGKNGGKFEEALNEHMSACVKFNRLGRAYPVLYQAEAMREILKKRTTRAKSTSPRVKGGINKGGITRSTSCIPAITGDIGDRKMLD